MTLRRPFAIYAITTHGLKVGSQLLEALGSDADLYVSAKFMAQAPAGSLPLKLPFSGLLASNFCAYDCHIFVVSVGAIVRMIAPLLESKKVDPAVLCIDDAGQFVISLLSGHVGRGNAFTSKVSTILGATPVITTASDVRGTLTVDILGRDLGWTLDDPDFNVTRGCAAVVNEAPVCFIQEAGEASWWGVDKPLPPGVTYRTTLAGVDPKAYEVLLITSDRDVKGSHPAHAAEAVIYRPKTLVLGIGCDRGTPVEMMERGIAQILKAHGLAAASVQALASIDLKADEEGLLELAKRHSWPFHTYPAAVLDDVPGTQNPSEVVKKHTGTRSVSEPAALLAAKAEQLLVAKTIYTEPGVGRSMTLAVARIPHPPRPQETAYATL